MIHPFVCSFSTTKWLGFKQPYIQFDAVFHADFEYGLKNIKKREQHIGNG